MSDESESALPAPEPTPPSKKEKKPDLSIADQKAARLLTGLSLGTLRFFAVPQGYKQIVTQWGKLIRIADPGLSQCLSLWGLVQQPSVLVPMKEQVKDYPEEMVFTKDGVECIIDTVVFFRIEDVEKAIFEVEDYEEAIRDIVQAVLRNECGKLPARELLASRQQLSDELRRQLEEDTEEWGIHVRLVEIKGIEIDTHYPSGTNPSES